MYHSRKISPVPKKAMASASWRQRRVCNSLRCSNAFSGASTASSHRFDSSAERMAAAEGVAGDAISVVPRIVSSALTSTEKPERTASDL